jgi:hypothetical protein
VKRLALSALLLTLLTACQVGTYDSPGDIPFKPGEHHWGLGLGFESGPVAVAGPSMFGAGTPASALAGIRAARGVQSDLPVASIELGDTYLYAVVQGTTSPTDRDGYRVGIDGTLKHTVKDGSQDAAELFDAGTVRWDLVPDLATKALAALDLGDGAHVTQVYVRRASGHGRALFFRVECKGTDHYGWVAFDPSGMQINLSKT